MKLYLYGYLNRVRSSRMLEREARRNVELMWLLERLSPSYKTIADFRKDNARALRRTHAQFIVLCRTLGLFGGKRIAVDGSFFKGNVSKKSFRTHKRLSAQIATLEQELAQWHQALDTADREEAGQAAQPEEAALADKLQALREALAEKTEQRERLEQMGKTQHSAVDADARLLNKRGQKVAGYNVQIATDAKHKLILAAVRQRCEAHPERLAERCALVEHPFGTLKRRAGWDHFLVRGLEKVRGEWSLMALAYNFTRVMNLLGPERFREICRQLAEVLEGNTKASPLAHLYRRLGWPGYALLSAFCQLRIHTRPLRARRLAAWA